MAFDFEYYSPTKVIFGKNTELRVGKLIKELNCQKSIDTLRWKKCGKIRIIG